jgi:L-2-hydroxycarboxylate dehydrogenase (NAD+)
MGKGISHFFGAIDIDGSIDKAEFKKQIDEWIRVFRKTKPAPGTGGPLIPVIRREKPRQSEPRQESRC